MSLIPLVGRPLSLNVRLHVCRTPCMAPFADGSPPPFSRSPLKNGLRAESSRRTEEHMATLRERLRARREAERRRVRSFKIGVSEDDLRLLAKHGTEAH